MAMSDYLLMRILLQQIYSVKESNLKIKVL